jgi:hypothetical protein
MESAPRVNPFEIALWILAVVLTVGGAAGGLWASRVMNVSYSCTGNDCSPPVDYALAQTLYMMAPPAFTAGLIAVVLSVALRAALVAASRRRADADARAAELAASESTPVATSVAQPEQPAVPSTTAYVDPASFAPPQFRSRRRAVDHSAFQRPTAD